MRAEFAIANGLRLWVRSDIRMCTNHNQFCITLISADREANCA